MFYSSSPSSALSFNDSLRLNSSDVLSVNPFLVVASHKPTIKRSNISCRAKASSGGLASNEKRQQFLERYGIDPDDFEGPKVKGREKEKRRGKGARVMPPQEPKPPRTTHMLLQVLGGTARRRKLRSPKGMDVRPMMEVVRGATFDILQVAGGCPVFLRPGRWLDLYSGTGSVGIEAISRGCSEVHFVEMDPWVVSEVLKPNLEATGFLDVSTIHTVSVENFLKQAQRLKGKDGPFDYISVTPPYTAVDYGVLMAELLDSCLVGEDTFIVVEYPFGTAMPDTYGCLVKIADRRFGRTNLAMYGPTWSQKKKSVASTRMIASP
ncbi:hypothetical protein H6P81_020314 [Aristolochia fimbriata]|uniref:rRNA methyltransferase YlbH n=1 Tax=Aristolochia fimbriata TaxID=158543 RepID=A0AAV7DUC7_ARIFI|nr:hypothetical protein H6P81_020314 [Aristolochia fimbriata]